MSIYSYSSTPVPFGVTMASDGSTLFHQYPGLIDSQNQQSMPDWSELNYENFMTDDNNAPLQTPSELMQNINDLSNS